MYSKKYVTTSFREALKQVVCPQPEGEELQEMGLADGKPNAIDPNKKDEKMAYSNDGTKSAPQSKVDKYKKTLTGEEEEAPAEVELTEEEIIQALEEELSPHIEHLLDEGFTEDEIEHIILEMLAEEEAEEEEADDSKHE